MDPSALCVGNVISITGSAVVRQTLLKQANFGAPEGKKKKGKEYIRLRDCGALMAAGCDLFRDAKK